MIDIFTLRSWEDDYIVKKKRVNCPLNKNNIMSMTSWMVAGHFSNRIAYESIFVTRAKKCTLFSHGRKGTLQSANSSYSRQELKYLCIHKGGYALIYSSERIPIAFWYSIAFPVNEGKFRSSILSQCEYHRSGLFRLSRFDDIHRKHVFNLRSFEVTCLWSRAIWYWIYGAYIRRL